MDCRDVRELADSFLAGELLTETNHEILRHLDSCPPCRAGVAARRGWATAVRTAFDRSPDLQPRREFAAELRSILHRAADRTGGGAKVGRWWALAATVLLAAAVALLYRVQATSALAVARAAVGDHRNCALQFRLAEKPIALDEAARRYGRPYDILQRLPPVDIVTAAGVAHVIERHACVYQGRRFAHVVLEYRGERVSLMVTAAGRGVATAPATEARIDGMNVDRFGAGSTDVFVAGDVPSAALAALTDAIAGPLRRELAGV